MGAFHSLLLAQPRNQKRFETHTPIVLLVTPPLIDDVKIDISHHSRPKHTHDGDEATNKYEVISTKPSHPCRPGASLAEVLASTSVTKCAPIQKIFSYEHAYDSDIIAHWRLTERCNLPNPSYMKLQPIITVDIRELAVDWMVDVQLQYDLQEESLFLAVNLFDRILGKYTVTCKNLQLLACTVLWIASKYEEGPLAPHIDDLLSACACNPFKQSAVIATEQAVLTVLQFKLASPLSIHFLQYFSRCCDLSIGGNTWHMALYFLELTLQFYIFLEFHPSKLAASALYLAMNTAQGSNQDLHVWSTAQEQLIAYTTDAIASCVCAMYSSIHELETQSNLYQTVKYKFLSEKYDGVAKQKCRKPSMVDNGR